MSRFWLLTGALALAFAGCEKSQPKPAVQTDRTKDAAYKQQLKDLHHEQTTVAARAAKIRAQLKALGDVGNDAAKRAKQADLTNRLAQCQADMEAARKHANAAVRTRILQEKAAREAVKAGRATEAK